MDRQFAIDRHSGISAWKQIADQISRAINAGDYDETGMVPPETVLAERFGVNRHTVRNAIAALAEDGVLRRVQGRGTLIEKKTRLVFPISRRTRFSEGLGRQTPDMGLSLLAEELLPANAAIASALGIEEQAPLIGLTILGLAGGEPVSLAACYFPAERFPDMAKHVKANRSITRAFAAQGVDDYIRVSTEVSGRIATADESRLLRLAPGAVVLEALSVNADSSGRPVQFSKTVFAADRISLRLDTDQ
jgi:GntR family phosphonate transport system transcriptional regulator